MILETYSSKTILHSRALESMVRPGRLYYGTLYGKKMRFYVLGFATLDGKEILIREKGRVRKVIMDDIENVEIDKFSN